MHLSGVLRYVATESGILKAIADIDEEALPLRMALGLAWEEFAVSMYPEVDWQPGEIVVDGIAMNCDGLSENPKYPQLDAAYQQFMQQADQALPVVVRPATQLDEFKLTWKKAKTAQDLLRDEWYWLQQGRGYCWGYEANLVRWHVCYVNGDYRGSGPIYKRYLIHFSDAEVESTQKMIQKNRAAAEEKGHAE
jgi:hypothetical protein